MSDRDEESASVILGIIRTELRQLIKDVDELKEDGKSRADAMFKFVRRVDGIHDFIRRGLDSIKAMQKAIDALHARLSDAEKKIEALEKTDDKRVYMLKGSKMTLTAGVTVVLGALSVLGSLGFTAISFGKAVLTWLKANGG